jgi:hypothetical protein
MKARSMSRHRGIAAITIACAMALAGCAYSLINGGQVNEKIAGNVEQGIQKIRQLSFKSHVPLVLKTPDEVEQMVIADLHRDYTDEELDADGKAGAMLGLFPPGIDLKAESVKLLKSQIAGFYDPHAKQMVLVEGAASVPLGDRMLEFMVQRDLVNDMLLAHELTHALQDQNFALQDNLDKLKNNSDKEIALKSVAEGDATIAGFAYVAGRMDNSIADTIDSSMKDLPQTFAAQSKDTPEGLGYPLIFQYSQGVHFVREAYRRGGWKAVDALYSKPPQSSQQLIDPTLYFDRPTPPVEVQLAGYQSVLPQWTDADADTFGELSVELILQIGYGKDAPDVEVAKQWAGDRMTVLRRGADVAVVWMLVFRDGNSAQRFVESYRALLSRTRASTPHHLESRNHAVLVLAGNIVDQASTLAPAVWKASTIGEVKPPAGPGHPLKADAIGSNGVASAQ